MDELKEYVASKKEERLLLKLDFIDGVLKRKPNASQAELSEMVKTQLVEALFQLDLRKTADQSSEIAVRLPSPYLSETDETRKKNFLTLVVLASTKVDEIEARNEVLRQQIAVLQQQLVQVRSQRPKVRQQTNRAQEYFFAATLVAKHLLQEHDKVEMDLEYLRWTRDTTLMRAFDYFTGALEPDPVRTT
jgi:hypothetical protein